ncbi:hypothetical protein [Fusibacter ferrireducens]|uniref:Uncharacterized protein n=1 Tax=Fusibacter ferrireducens TaxID=2785058 RepID=A0ABR9ZME9_9FIRM|nr:hypothetical protein [Fusibacter ferrireducens]MBF4691648.1 hypothetical protein [Fusibacter ferrireducens]
MSSKAKAESLIEYFNNTNREMVEIYVEGIGWLIILKENIEIVSDNWFASTKYNSSTIEIFNSESSLMRLTNVYKLNSSFVENANNVKYNLMFEDICIFIDKVSAFF